MTRRQVSAWKRWQTIFYPPCLILTAIAAGCVTTTLLCCFPSARKTQSQELPPVQPLNQWLQTATLEFAPEKDSARILKDHLPWLEQHLRGKLKDREGPLDAAPLLAEAANALEAHLQLAEKAAQGLKKDLHRLIQQLPDKCRATGLRSLSCIAPVDSRCVESGSTADENVFRSRSNGVSADSKRYLMWSGKNQTKPLNQELHGTVLDWEVVISIPLRSPRLWTTLTVPT